MSKEAGMDAGKKFEAGLKTRREVLGEAYVDAALGRATEFSWPMQKLVTEFCWDELWNRPGMSRRDRSLLNLAMLAVLNRPQELKAHVKGALTNGVTREEMTEVFLQVAVYAGMPAAIDAFRTAQAALDEAEG